MPVGNAHIPLFINTRQIAKFCLLKTNSVIPGTRFPALRRKPKLLITPDYSAAYEYLQFFRQELARLLR